MANFDAFTDSPSDDSDSNLMERIAQGDPEAIERVWREHYHPLRDAVRKRINAMPKLAGKESDIAIQAMQEFLAGITAGKFPDLADINSAWKLLKTIASRKINDEIKYHRAEKRGGKVQIHGQSSSNDQSTHSKPFAAVDFLPDHRNVKQNSKVDVDELFAKLMLMLPDDRSRQIILLRLGGTSPVEIAELLQCSTRTVQRRLQEIEGIWNDEFLGGR